MQSLEAKKNYKNSLVCAGRMFRDEGILSFWSGAMPRLARLILSGGIVFTGFVSSSLKDWVRLFVLTSLQVRENYGRVGFPRSSKEIYLKRVDNYYVLRAWYDLPWFDMTPQPFQKLHDMLSASCISI